MTERQVFDNLAELKSTTIVIAHRLSTIARADLIMVMDAARSSNTAHTTSSWR